MRSMGQAEHRGRLLAGALEALPLVLAAGCSRTATCVEDCGAGESGESGESGETGDPNPDPDDSLLNLTQSKAVDILFVIDNSGSMAEEQTQLTADVGAFIEVLEHPDVHADYRIGITTTDNGNPWCPPNGTTPEAGALVLSSCKTRLDDFLFNAGQIDARDLACNDICTLDAAALEILPTVTELDPEPKPRPWLERITGQSNLPPDTDTAAAFACFAPQGINGCGFESQLESMYLALSRAQTIGEASYGFLRPDAILAVVILSDEADCSYNEDYASIFDAEGDKAFWSDPMAVFPTSAVCWNAGVECTGDPSNYASCDPVNKGVDGQVGVVDAEAVLHPMSRYIDLLDDLEQAKQTFDPDQEIIVALIGGVDSQGETVYAEVGASDPEFQDNFGIGPGCEAPNPNDPNNPTRAVPPVRQRALVEAFTPGNMFSICEGDYAAALATIAEHIADQIQPICFPHCVADNDPATKLVEPTCTITEHPPGSESQTIPECLRDEAGYVIDPDTQDYAMPNADANVCFAQLTDPGDLSSDPADDMSSWCLDQNFNLEVVIARRPGFPPPSGTAITGSCTVAEFPEITCPGIGG
jgi:hypothetical protein